MDTHTHVHTHVHTHAHVRRIMMDPEQKGEDGGEVTDETLKKLQEQYLRNLKLQGVEGIRKAFIRQARACFCLPWDCQARLCCASCLYCESRGTVGACKWYGKAFAHMRMHRWRGAPLLCQSWRGKAAC